MPISWKTALLAALVLGAIHVGLAVLPGQSLSPSHNLALFATNLYVLYGARSLLLAGSGRALGLFAAGYGVLFLLLLVLLDRTMLFVLVVVFYVSAIRSPFMLGMLGLFILSFVILQPYAFETFLPLCGVYVLLWRARGAPWFVQACLGVGLVGGALLLLPLLHLSLKDSAQTLWLTAGRDDVQDAILVSLASSSLATAITACWGIPLAYALVRVDLKGKSVVESLLDVPILVPHSVIGIAFLLLLGQGSALGDWLETGLGVRVAGRFVGIVLAQMFVAAPFLVKTAMTAFEGVPLRLEHASRTLGASAARTFLWIALPLAGRGVAAGLILAWARAISEFGALVLFASTPLSAPVLVHTEFLRAGASESRPVATLLLLTCVWIFVVLQLGRGLLPAGTGRTLRVAQGFRGAHPR